MDTPTPSTVGLGLLITFLLAAVLPAQPPAIDLEGDFPMWVIDGEPEPAVVYASYLGQEEHYRQAASAGLRVFVIPAFLGDRGVNPGSGIGPFREAIWQGPGELDFASLDADLTAVRNAHPDARVIVRLYLDPPTWWEQAHPEGAARLPDGSTFRQSFFSPLWREQTAEVVERCVDWLLASDHAEHLIGLHPSAGHTEEWFYHYDGAFHDLNPARTDAFRHWLREAYDDEAALQQAWNDPDAAFDRAEPADISGEQPELRWRDPVDERPVIDTFRFHSETMAENIAFFARLIKDASDDRLLVGAFYGYHGYVTDPRHGHGALGKLLREQIVDFLASPNTYNRVAGEDWPPMAAVDSIKLHGTLWTAENDTRTSRTTLLREQAPEITPEEDYYDHGVWLGPDSDTESVALLRKNVSRMLTAGYGAWWFDMWGGWFDHPDFLDVLRQSHELVRDRADEPAALPSQVAVLLDEQMPFYDASFGQLSRRIIVNRKNLPKAGVPYDIFLRSDLTNIPWDQYKLVWFMGFDAEDLTDTEAGHFKPWRDAGGTALAMSPRGTQVVRAGGTERLEVDAHQLELDTLSTVLRDADVHRYLETDDVLHAGHGWIGVHTVNPGPRTLHLPERAAVTDALTDEELADDADAVELHFKDAPATRILRISPAR